MFYTSCIHYKWCFFFFSTPQVPESAWPTSGIMPGAWAICRSTFGEGALILFAPHPELTAGRPGKPQPGMLIVSAVRAVAPTWTQCAGGDGVRSALPPLEDSTKSGTGAGEVGGESKGGGESTGGGEAGEAREAGEAGEGDSTTNGPPLNAAELDLSLRLSSCSSGVSEGPEQGSTKYVARYDMHICCVL